MMKTFVKKHPIEGKESKDDEAYVLLDEDETSWMKNDQSVCHGPMKKVLDEHVKKVASRHKAKYVIVFDSNHNQVMKKTFNA